VHYNEPLDRKDLPRQRRPVHRMARLSWALPCLLTISAAWSAPAAPQAALRELPAAWLDDRGQPFDLHSVQGHPVVLTMAYATCHRVCPVTMRRLEELQQQYDHDGEKAEFVVIGYDPESDDPPAWHQYRQTRHLTRPNWHFLTGSRDAVQQAAQQLGFKFWKYDQHVMHGSRILYFDEHGALHSSEDTSENNEVSK
jgi:protein SCO1/2